MLTMEEKELLNSIEQKVTKIHADYEAGRITEAQYQEMCDLVTDAEAKILAISTIGGSDNG